MADVLVGVSLPDGNPDPDFLRRRLRAFAEDGFDCVEFTLDTLPLIISGALQADYTAFLSGLLKEHDFLYSAHIGLGVNLRDTRNFEIQKQTLFTSIELCHRLNIRTLVLHYEVESRDAAIEEMFVQTHEEAASLAALDGLSLCIENIEVERLEPVIEFVRKVARSNLLLAFDTGHAYLAARYFHFDFLAALQAARPFIGHVHLSDNTGIFEELRITNRAAYDQLPIRYRYTFGRGDVHLPPFWGSIPFGEVFARLRGYRGMYMCEYNSEDFLPFNRRVQQKVREAVRAAG
jgi:sugar phosphate isomerase/epimerase